MEADDSSAAPVKPVPPMDRKVWGSFHQVFCQVQYLLDHNRLLINEINQNHESKIPESLTQNVLLIRELNSNIAKVVELYENLSSSFVKFFDNPSDADSVKASTKPAEGGSMKPPSGSESQKSVRSS